MSKTIEFYFDFGSPTAYLAYQRLLQLREQYGASIEYRPMLLGGVFKATGNRSPIAVPAKGAYMMNHDLPRFARRYGVALNSNPHFPINTLYLMRGAIAAREMGCFDTFVDVVYRALWQDGKNMGDPGVVVGVLAEAGLDAAALMARSQEADVKAALVSATEAAVARGVFGAPTLFMGEEMFFGQDRLDFVEEILAAQDLRSVSSNGA